MIRARRDHRQWCAPALAIIALVSLSGNIALADTGTARVPEICRQVRQFPERCGTVPPATFITRLQLAHEGTQAPHVAFGDGRHDDFCALQDSVRATQPGGTLHIPSGFYLLCDTLVVDSPITIVGDGPGDGGPGDAMGGAFINLSPPAPLQPWSPVDPYTGLPAATIPSWNDASPRQHPPATDPRNGPTTYPRSSLESLSGTVLFFGCGQLGPCNPSGISVVLAGSVPDSVNIRDIEIVGNLGSDSIGIGATGIARSTWRNLLVYGFATDYALTGSSFNTFYNLRTGNSGRGLLLENGSVGNTFVTFEAGQINGTSVDIGDASLNQFLGLDVAGSSSTSFTPSDPGPPPVAGLGHPVLAPTSAGNARRIGVGIDFRGGVLNVVDHMWFEAPYADQAIRSSGGSHNIAANVQVSNPGREVHILGGEFFKLKNTEIINVQSTAPPSDKGLASCTPHDVTSHTNAESRQTWGPRWLEQVASQFNPPLPKRCSENRDCSTGLPEHPGLCRAGFCTSGGSTPGPQCPAHYYWPTIDEAAALDAEHAGDPAFAGFSFRIRPGGVFVEGGKHTRIINCDSANPPGLVYAPASPHFSQVTVPIRSADGVTIDVLAPTGSPRSRSLHE